MASAGALRDAYIIIGYEGGYSFDKNDKGGPTNHGITIATLAAWRKRPVTIEEVKALTLEEVEQIYIEEYADVVKHDSLPDGLALAVFDMAINSGPGQAAKTLQKIVGTTKDGVIGAKTIAAVLQRDVSQLVMAYCDERLAFMKTLDDWKYFSNGWTNRVNAVKRDSIFQISGVKIQAGATPVPAPKASPTDVKLTASKSANINIAATVAAAGVLASSIGDQLAPLSGFKYAQYAASACTIIATLAGIFNTLNRLRSGQATV